METDAMHPNNNIKEATRECASTQNPELDDNAAREQLPTEAEGPNGAVEMAQVCRGRANIYGLLARLYRQEVDQQLFDELYGMYYPAETGNELMDKGYYLMARHMSNAWFDQVNALSVDFSKVFLGAGIDAHSAAYPFESVYTSEKRLTMQAARDEVLAIYRSNGLDKKESWKVGEDHIAVELEFMQDLSLRAADALESDDRGRADHLLKTQANFLEDHLSAWVPVMAQDMLRFADTDFYRGLAKVTCGFLEEDEALLADAGMDEVA